MIFPNNISAAPKGSIVISATVQAKKNAKPVRAMIDAIFCVLFI
jgi:hypothetical protein